MLTFYETIINNIKPRGVYEEIAWHSIIRCRALFFVIKYFIKFHLENLGELDNPKKGVAAWSGQ